MPDEMSPTLTVAFGQCRSETAHRVTYAVSAHPESGYVVVTFGHKLEGIGFSPAEGAEFLSMLTQKLAEIGVTPGGEV